MSSRRSVSIVVAASLIFGRAEWLRAQVSQDTTQLKELVVTATRLPTPPDAVVASITTISGDDLRARGVHFVQDALREVPGATVVQTGSYGGISSLFLRGGESDYVKVLIDGVPVNQSGGGYDWANLTADNIDRIEILRGPGSVLYGSDAVSGVVQVFTRRGEGRTTIEGGAEGGTFGTIDGHLGVLGGSRRFSYSADASRFTTDGIYAFNNDYGNTVLSGSLAGTLDPRSNGSLSVRYGDNRYHFPTDFAGVPSDSNQSNAEKALSVGGELVRRLGDRYHVKLSAGGSRSDREFDDPADNAADTLGFGFASHRDSRADRGNLDGRIDATVSSALTVTAGMQVERETERQTGETSSNFGGIATTPDTPFDRGRRTFGYYAQGVLDIVSGLAVNANARIDDNSAFGTFFTYRAGAAFRFATGTRLRASLGRAFKAPTFCEQFCDAPFVVGDSSLSPERSTSWEIGVEQGIAGGRLSVWATWFDQHFKDMIVYDGSAAPGDPTYRNGAGAHSRGLEAGLTTAIGRSLRASASYTYLNAKATDDAGMPSPSFAEGQRLIRRPTHSAELALRGRVFDRATLGGSVTYVGKRDDVDFNQFPSRRAELPGYALVDLAGEIELVRSGPGRPGVSGVLRIENLFDKRYDQVVGFSGRRRGVFGGARFQF
ncbi:MAG: TonB-dependent receptor [Gemmatimonadales bacterium]